MRIPTHLKDHVKEYNDIDAVETTVILSTKSGNDLLEIWYYGALAKVSGETYPQIVEKGKAPVLIVAKDISTGEEFIIFDGGAKHGYNNLFCDEYEAKNLKNRALQRYTQPASKIELSLFYNIEYDGEKEDYDFDDNNQTILVDDTIMAWEEVKKNGFDAILLSIIDQNGEKHPIFEQELA